MPGSTSRTSRPASVDLPDPVGPTTATVVVVAYRQATIALADEVVWLEHGRVLSRGSHEQLLAEVPGYAALVRAYSQTEGVLA